MSQLVLPQYVWVRAKQFGCHSVIPSVSYPGIHFEAVRQRVKYMYLMVMMTIHENILNSEVITIAAGI